MSTEISPRPQKSRSDFGDSVPDMLRMSRGEISQEVLTRRLGWEQFRDGMALLLAAFPKLEPDEVTVKAWYALLQDLAPGAFHRAIIAFCQLQRELYPGTNVVATLREYALPDDAPTSCLAWAEVLEAMHRVGPYHQRPAFSHPRIAQAVEAIGWRTLCDSEAIGVERSHFLKAYEQMSQREHERRLLGSPSNKPLALSNTSEKCA